MNLLIFLKILTFEYFALICLMPFLGIKEIEAIQIHRISNCPNEFDFHEHFEY